MSDFLQWVGLISLIQYSLVFSVTVESLSWTYKSAISDLKSLYYSFKQWTAKSDVET